MWNTGTCTYKNQRTRRRKRTVQHGRWMGDLTGDCATLPWVIVPLRLWCAESTAKPHMECWHGGPHRRWRLAFSQSPCFWYNACTSRLRQSSPDLGWQQNRLHKSNHVPYFFVLMNVMRCVPCSAFLFRCRTRYSSSCWREPPSQDAPYWHSYIRAAPSNQAGDLCPSQVRIAYLLRNASMVASSSRTTRLAIPSQLSGRGGIAECLTVMVNIGVQLETQFVRCWTQPVPMSKRVTPSQLASCKPSGLRTITFEGY